VTDAVQIALIVAMPPTVVAIGSIFVAVLQDRRAGKKLDHITVLTNSTLTAANKRIDELEQTVEALLTKRT
jgi:hypothetical protein